MDAKLIIRPSEISGVGAFITSVQKAGTRLFVGAEYKNKRIRLHKKYAKFINHSETPTCIFEKFYDKWFVTVINNMGKNTDNTEVTVNYDAETTPHFIKRF